MDILILKLHSGYKYYVLVFRKKYKEVFHDSEALWLKLSLNVSERERWQRKCGKMLTAGKSGWRYMKILITILGALLYV